MDSPWSPWAISSPSMSASGILTAPAIFLLFLTLAFALIFLHSYYFSAETHAPIGPPETRGVQTAPPPPSGIDPAGAASVVAGHGVPRGCSERRWSGGGVRGVPGRLEDGEEV